MDQQGPGQGEQTVHNRFCPSAEKHRVMEIMRTWVAGVLHGYDDPALREACGGDPQSPLGDGRYRVVKAAREALVREAILIRVVPGEGLCRVPDDEVSPYVAEDGVKRIRRQASKSAKHLGCADPSKLTDTQRAHWAATATHLAAIKAVSSRKSARAIEGAVTEDQKRLDLRRTLDLLTKRDHDTT